MDFTLMLQVAMALGGWVNIVWPSFGQWTAEKLCYPCISAKEVFPIVLANSIWGNFWSLKYKVVYSDMMKGTLDHS